MIKKFLFAFCFLFSFFFMFLFGFDKINILAYSQYDNTLGTYPAKLDIDNYNTENLINFKNISKTRTYHNDNTYDYTTYSINQIGTGDFSYAVYTFYNVTEIGNTYNISFKGKVNDTRANFRTVAFGITPSSPDDRRYGSIQMTTNEELYNFSFTAESTNFCIIIYITTTYDGTGFSIDISNLMLVKGESSKPFGIYFNFGNMVGYQLNLYNPTSNNITTNVLINNYDNNLVTRSVTVNANSYYELKGNISTNSHGTTDTRFYLPYNISSDGSISMDYKLTIDITDSDIVIKSDENIQNDTYFLFYPVFNAYYKGEPTNNLYFKNSYVFNSLMYTGMNASGQVLNSLYFNCYGNVIDNYCIYDSLTIAPNTTENVLAFNVTSTGIRNNINFNDVFIYEYTDSYGFDSISTLFSFQLNIGNTNTSLTSGVSYDINMSELTLLVINNSSTTSPLPNNPDTYNKYNVCDAWYDIPCQLGNAITYVIYEAPIISPVLTFIVTFITMFSSLVSFVDLFKSFGVVFGCFVIYMFIELLHKYSK